MFQSLLGRVIISGFQQILKNEGLPGLYRGLSPTIVALFPTWAVRNLVYLTSFISTIGRIVLLQCNIILAQHFFHVWVLKCGLVEQPMSYNCSSETRPCPDPM